MTEEEKTITVMCPSCGNIFDLDSRIDEDWEQQTICPACEFTTSSWQFDPVFDPELEEEEA